MGDIERAKREIRYTQRSADDRRWDQLESRIKTIETALEGVSDAEKAPVLAELAPLRERITKSIREENPGRIEREIKRNLSAAADEIARGYTTSPQIQKSMDRLASAEAREGKYMELAGVTEAAWPANVSSIKADVGFDPQDASAKGKRILLKGIRHRT